MNNTKAEKYLYKRLELMYSEKTMLTTNLEKIQLDINEIDTRISELLEAVDTAMEVFSPKPKKNDFIKEEVDKLKLQKDNLKDRFTEFSKQSFFVEENIKELRDILEDSSEEILEVTHEENNEENVLEKESTESVVTEESTEPVVTEEISESVVTEESTEPVATEENIESVVSVENTEPLVSEENSDEEQILEQQKDEKVQIIKDLYYSVLHELSSLTHRCEMCAKIMDVDSIRAKLEIENMTKILKKLIGEFENIIYDLYPMLDNNMENDETKEQL